MNFYAYCLSDEVTMQMLGEACGLSGASLVLIEHEGLIAVVSRFESDAVKVTRGNVLAHERVVQQVLTQTTPLPFRFGTLVSETRLRNYLALQRSALNAQLACVRGCVEMSVKLIQNSEAFESAMVEQPLTVGNDVQSATDHSAQEEQSAQSKISNHPASGAGTAYLEMKRRELMGDELRQKRAEKVAGWLAARLASVVHESEVSVRSQDALFVTAAFLVERVRLEEYRARLREAERERREVHFLTSGPWPPYSFSSLSS